MTATTFSVLNAVLCAICVVAAIFAAMFAHRAAASRGQNACSCESRLQSLTSSVSDITETMQELANRVKMMKVRSASRHAGGSTGDPDPYKDPDGWRKMMNARMINRSSPNGAA